MFQHRSVDLWAVGERTAYHLRINKLYGSILPERCKVKLSSSQDKLYVILHKQADAEWRFLKG